MKPLSKQQLEVLGLLRAAGPRGVSNGEFAYRRILRYSARICELRKLGYVISTEKDAGSKVRFVLLAEPDVEAGRGESLPPATAGLSTEPETLFPEPRTATQPHWQDAA